MQDFKKKLRDEYTGFGGAPNKVRMLHLCLWHRASAVHCHDPICSATHASGP